MAHVEQLGNGTREDLDDYEGGHVEGDGKRGRGEFNGPVPGHDRDKGDYADSAHGSDHRAHVKWYEFLQVQYT